MSGSSWRTVPLPPGWGATCTAILASRPGLPVGNGSWYIASGVRAMLARFLGG